MKLVFALALATLGASCAASPHPSKSLTDTSWSVGCQGTQKDQYGAVIGQEKCWAMISAFNANIMDGLSIGVSNIFEIDKNGPRMPRAIGDRSCAVTPRRVAVDGERIDHLPMQKQIAAVLGGRRLVRERIRGWPYCNLQDESADLTGAKAAYENMVAQWDHRQSIR